MRDRMRPPSARMTYLASTCAWRRHLFPQAPWLAAYGLLSKSTPSIPEVALRMASCPEFHKSYSHALLYPPLPRDALAAAGAPPSGSAGPGQDSVAPKAGNFSWRMYQAYCAAAKGGQDEGQPARQSFLQWHREHEYDQQRKAAQRRRGKNMQHGRAPTLVCACRYWYELTDGYWGQMALTQLPHATPADLLPDGARHLDCMENFVGVLRYLMSWTFLRFQRGGDGEKSGFVIGARGFEFHEAALPLDVLDDGTTVPLGEGAGRRPPADGALPDGGVAVFPSERAAYSYMRGVCRRDLSYRGFRDERLRTFEMAADAAYLLHRRALRAQGDAEFQMLKADWERLNRPARREHAWSEEQRAVLQRVVDKTSIDDQAEKERGFPESRWLYVAGAPGSGKSAVLLEAALSAAARGLGVLIVCPTGVEGHGGNVPACRPLTMSSGPGLGPAPLAPSFPSPHRLSARGHLPPLAMLPLPARLLYALPARSAGPQLQVADP